MKRALRIAIILVVTILTVMYVIQSINKTKKEIDAKVEELQAIPTEFIAMLKFTDNESEPNVEKNATYYFIKNQDGDLLYVWVESKTTDGIKEIPEVIETDAALNIPSDLSAIFNKYLDTNYIKNIEMVNGKGEYLKSKKALTKYLFEIEYTDDVDKALSKIKPKIEKNNAADEVNTNKSLYDLVEDNLKNIEIYY